MQTVKTGAGTLGLFILTCLLIFLPACNEDGQWDWSAMWAKKDDSNAAGPTEQQEQPTAEQQKIHEQDQTIEQLEQENERLTEDNLTLADKIAELEAEIGTLRLANDKQNDAIRSFQSTLQTTVEERNRYQQQLNQATDENEQLKQRNKSLKDQLDVLQQDFEALREKYEQLAQSAPTATADQHAEEPAENEPAEDLPPPDKPQRPQENDQPQPNPAEDVSEPVPFGQ